jgi:hypothetical protein
VSKVGPQDQNELLESPLDPQPTLPNSVSVKVGPFEFAENESTCDMGMVQLDAHACDENSSNAASSSFMAIPSRVKPF